MGKASKVKVEVGEVRELVDLIGVLKDVADMEVPCHVQPSGSNSTVSMNLSRNSLVWSGYSEVAHPLVSNSNPNSESSW